MNTVVLPENTILVSTVRQKRPLLHTSPHQEFIVMYLSSERSFGLRRSCTEVRRPTFWWFCVNPGIPPQMPQKVTTHIQTNFFGLVACRRLSSSEGAPSGFKKVFCAKPRSRRRCQAQERRTCCCFCENILPQEKYQLVPEKSLQCLPCATQMHTRR